MPENPSPGNASRDVVAARLRLTPALEVRVLAQRFREGFLVHIREFALTNENEYVATAHGIALPVTRLPELLDAVRDLREAGDQEGVVARISASGGRQIQFAVTKWQGHTKADIRMYFTRPESAELLPTKKGLRLNLGLLGEVERGLEALDRELDR